MGNSVNLQDSLKYTFQALKSHPLRTGLTLLGIAVGVSAVITLTALGEGARQYVLQEFAQMGSHLVMVIPGKVETSGAIPWGGVTHDLTLEDYQALSHLWGLNNAAPVVLANEYLSAGSRKRAVAIIGTTPSYLALRRLKVSFGQFFQLAHPKEQKMEMVLGAKASRELFPVSSPLGKRIALGGYRFRIIGVLEPRGRVFGIDFDDMAFIPVQTAMEIFDRSSLFRILLEASSADTLEKVKAKAHKILKERHRADDVTLITQEAMLSSFSAIMQLLTLSLAAIGVISLSVAGLGIMNLMLITVAEREEEIGLLGALGATPSMVRRLFLGEAFSLSFLGASVGTIGGGVAIYLLKAFLPTFPAHPPAWAIPSAWLLALSFGLFFGWFPAWRASRLDPLQALLGR